MIQIYTGTPGSGKSLHMAKDICDALEKTDCEVLANFTISQYDKSGKKVFKDEQFSRFHYVSDDELKPSYLINFAENYWAEHDRNINHNKYEQQIRLYIDEAQQHFNSRDWQKNNTCKIKDKWTWFFSVHRHFGFKITLCSQLLSNLDKQVRGVIEYELHHRKLANMGAGGAFFNLLFGGNMYLCVCCWAPMHMKISQSFFRYKDKFGNLYDTHAMFCDDRSPVLPDQGAEAELRAI